MMPMHLRPLPPEAQRLCQQLDLPPRLLAHLQIVHDVAADLVVAIHREFPTIKFDEEAVLLGAATHDLGKVLYPDELTGPGHRHEDGGPGLLMQCGVVESLARFAKTHGQWTDNLEDLIVALADTIWKGKRVERLEEAMAKVIAARIGLAEWEIVLRLDDIIEPIATRAERRLDFSLRKTPSSR